MPLKPSRSEISYHGTMKSQKKKPPLEAAYELAAKIALLAGTTRTATMGGDSYSDVLLHFSCFEAAGADFDVANGSVVDRAHGNEIGIPGSARAILRVRNVISEKGALAAYFTYSGHSGLQIL